MSCYLVTARTPYAGHSKQDHWCPGVPQTPWFNRDSQAESDQ